MDDIDLYAALFDLFLIQRRALVRNVRPAMLRTFSSPPSGNPQGHKPDPAPRQAHPCQGKLNREG